MKIATQSLTAEVYNPNVSAFFLLSGYSWEAMNNIRILKLPIIIKTNRFVVARRQIAQNTDSTFENHYV